MRVRFTEEMTAILVQQQGGTTAINAYYDHRNEAGMEAQNEPRHGRLNVRFKEQGSAEWSYRTFSWRDLTII